MKTVVKFALTLCVVASGLFFSAAGWAAGARVEAMQMPAWVERAGIKQALKPGMELNPSDVLATGKGARLLVRMDEGSLIKMGEQASLDLTSMLPPVTEQGYFEAAINVIKGAFRFTTTAPGKERKRAVDVRIGTITLGIRGTDVWGSAAEDRDVLCLIEGKITAQREGEAAFSMHDPLSFYIAPRNKPALPVKPVPPEQLAQWAAETDVSSGAGVLIMDGIWAVNLMSLDSIAATEPVIKSLTDAGYAAEVHNFVWRNRDWYRIRITHFQTIEDARHFAAMIDGRFGIVKPWVVRF